MNLWSLHLQPPPISSVLIDSTAFSLIVNHDSLTKLNHSSNIWFPDTAATHHFTLKIQNLNLGSIPYQCLDQVNIGDNSSLPILNIGSTQLTTPSSNFHLKHLLHVSSISRNFLSIHQFCQNNNAFFEFHYNFFLWRIHTLKKFHFGILEDNLYALSLLESFLSFLPLQALIGTRTLAQL